MFELSFLTTGFAFTASFPAILILALLGARRGRAA
jgi:hypothetical protein